jgi:hypothetical protein
MPAYLSVQACPPPTTATLQSQLRQPPHEAATQALEQPVKETQEGAGSVASVAVTILAAGENAVQVVIEPVGAEQQSSAAAELNSHEIPIKEESSTCTGRLRMCSSPVVNPPFVPITGQAAKSTVSQTAVASSDGTAGPVAESGPVATETPASQQAGELSSGKEGVVGCFTKLAKAWSRGLHGCYALGE